jgi:hypothetical protein
MTLAYGYVKCKIKPGVEPYLKGDVPPRTAREAVPPSRDAAGVHPTGGTEQWDTAVNVGTNDRPLTRISIASVNAARDG